MGIRIDAHAARRAEERGAGEIEIQLVLERGEAAPARHGRLSKAYVFPFNRKWLGKRYEQKRIEVIYTIEGNDIIIVTKEMI